MAASAVGVAQGAFDIAVAYAKDRKAFGKSIGDFQGVQFMLADMHIQIEAARRPTSARVAEGSAPQKVADCIRQDIARWGAIIRERNIQAD